MRDKWTDRSHKVSDQWVKVSLVSKKGTQSISLTLALIVSQINHSPWLLTKLKMYSRVNLRASKMPLLYFIIQSLMKNSKAIKTEWNLTQLFSGIMITTIRALISSRKVSRSPNTATVIMSNAVIYSNCPRICSFFNISLSLALRMPSANGQVLNYLKSKV